jgi:chromosome segregation and condensation protein ScpB
MSKQKNGISLKMKLEAALLASGRPIHIEELSNILKVKPKEIKETLDSLKNIYSKESALELVEFKDSYMLKICSKTAFLQIFWL